MAPSITCFLLLAPDCQCLWSGPLWSCLWFSCVLASDRHWALFLVSITKTCLYNFDPLKPHFYIVKLGFTGVYIIFLISAQNTDCGYSLEPPRRGGSNEYPQSMFWAETWKISEFFFVVRSTVVLFVVFLCSGFRSPLSSFLGFHHENMPI